MLAHGQQELGFAVASARADAGIARASSKADRLAHGWVSATVEEVRHYAKVTDCPFTMEQARLMCRAMPDGADARAWGQVTRMAVRMGIIEPTGAFAKAASSNGSPKPLYCRGPKA